MAVARDGALYLHNMIKFNIHHPVFQKHLLKMGWDLGWELMLSKGAM